MGITAFIGRWFPELQAKQAHSCTQPLTGRVQESAVAMRGDAELGGPPRLLQGALSTRETLGRLTEALHLNRGLEQP